MPKRPPKKEPDSQKRALRLDSLSEVDRGKVENLLEALLPHLDVKKTILVGGLAIRHHVNAHGVAYLQEPFSDLDVITNDERAVRPSITKTFLVAHHHRQGQDGFYFSFVEPALKVSVDVFGGGIAIWPHQTTSVRWGKDQLKLCGIEDQLVKTVIDIGRISAEAKVDPKQFSEADLLRKLADLEVAERRWREVMGTTGPSLKDAYQQAVQTAEAHPEWLQKNPFQKPAGYVCRECVDSTDFPLTPPAEVERVLGYRM